MNRNIVLFLTLLWSGALVAMEGVQTAPALPSLENIGNFDQWLQEDESVKDDGDHSFQGRLRYVQKLGRKCEDYEQAVRAEWKDLTQIWLPRLCSSKVICNSTIGLRDRAVVHKAITKKCEAIAKGFIRIGALTHCLKQTIEKYSDLLDENGTSFWNHHDVVAVSNTNINRRYSPRRYYLIPEIRDYPVLDNHVSYACLHADPELVGEAIYPKNEKSIKEYILKTFSFHVPPQQMAHVFDTMNINQVGLFFTLAAEMRRTVRESEKINNRAMSRETFVNTLEIAWRAYTRSRGALRADAAFLSILSSLRTVAEDLRAIRFDEAAPNFIMPNERLRNLQLLLDPSHPQD